MIETSEEVGELAKALAQAQAEVETATKDRTNPHFGSKYADLASVWDACRKPLTKHGLSVVQLPVSDGAKVGVVTTLLHSSGQWMRSSVYTTPEKQTAQALGSAITYLRRYSLAAVASVAPDDDDGNAASGKAAPGKGEAPSRPANGNGAQKTDGKNGSLPRANQIPHDGTFASPAQVKKLHTLKGKVGGLTEDMYRKQLAAFKDCDGKPIATSKDLSEAQISNLISRYEAQVARQAQRAAEDPDLGAVVDAKAMITGEGVASIRTNLQARGMDEVELCAVFGVDSVAELPAEESGKALALVLSYGTPQYERVLADVTSQGGVQ